MLPLLPSKTKNLTYGFNIQPLIHSLMVWGLCKTLCKGRYCMDLSVWVYFTRILFLHTCLFFKLRARARQRDRQDRQTNGRTRRIMRPVAYLRFGKGAWQAQSPSL